MTEQESHRHTVVKEEIQSETFEGGVEIVNKVARFVLKGIQNLGLDEIVKNNIELAVVEAIDNIVEHAYEGKAGKVKVSFQKKDGNLIIVTRDNGKAFDPDKVKEFNPRELDNNSENRGAGIYMMRKLMDEVKYKFNPGENILTLTKKL